MKFAICNETFGDWSQEQICAQVAELGYTGLEIAPFTLAPRITDVSTQQLQALRRTAESAGITILGLHWLLAKTQGFHLTAADASIRQLTGEYFAALATATAELGGNILVLGSPQQRNRSDGMTPEDALQYAQDTIERCLPTLEQTQVTLCLEPLTPQETNFMNTAAEAVALMNRLQHPLVQLHLDVKAMAAESIPREQVIRDYCRYAKHFHANDENLRGPGFGAVDFVPIFQALADSQYSGWVSVEVFDYTPDPLTIARDSLAYMKQCLAQVQQ